jgi:Domain of unknown function (DUF4326)
MKHHEWTASQRERQAAVLAGKTVVANVHKGADEALVAWAKAENQFAYIGRATRGHRASPWHNPFRLGKHGDRDQIIAAYRQHLELSPGLKPRLPELRGKVLGCWCHPEPCHGDVLCEAVAE